MLSLNAFPIRRIRAWGGIVHRGRPLYWAFGSPRIASGEEMGGLFRTSSFLFLLELFGRERGSTRPLIWVWFSASCLLQVGSVHLSDQEVSLPGGSADPWETISPTLRPSRQSPFSRLIPICAPRDKSPMGIQARLPMWGLYQRTQFGIR